MPSSTIFICPHPAILNIVCVRVTPLELLLGTGVDRLTTVGEFGSILKVINSKQLSFSTRDCGRSFNVNLIINLSSGVFVSRAYRKAVA